MEDAVEVRCVGGPEREATVLWHFDGDEVTSLESTGLPQEALLERDLESWIERHPDLLGEPLLIIGRQVPIGGPHEKLDLLGVDAQGNTVIIELKRGELRDPVDIQALRYASYISRWPRRRIEQLAAAYLPYREEGDSLTSHFEETFGNFASNGDDTTLASLNARQRIIIVGEMLQSRLGSVALWLLEHGVDIKVVEMHTFRDPERSGFLLSPRVVIPQPGIEECRAQGEEEPGPWVVDGERWHLHERCKKPGRELLLAIIEQVKKRFPEASGPHWSQKAYVSFKLGNAIWLYLITQAQQATLNIPVAPGEWRKDELASRLGIASFASNGSMGEKLALPTGVEVRRRRNDERVIFTIKDQSLLKRDDFWKVIRKTRDDFQVGW